LKSTFEYVYSILCLNLNLKYRHLAAFKRFPQGFYSTHEIGFDVFFEFAQAFEVVLSALDQLLSFRYLLVNDQRCGYTVLL